MDARQGVGRRPVGAKRRQQAPRLRGERVRGRGLHGGVETKDVKRG